MYESLGGLNLTLPALDLRVKSLNFKFNRIIKQEYIGLLPSINDRLTRKRAQTEDS